MQGLGTLLCSLVLVAMTRCLGDNYDLQWRLALLIGALPMAGAFVLRYAFEVTVQLFETALMLDCVLWQMAGGEEDTAGIEQTRRSDSKSRYALHRVP